jgi:RES domain-containing protein
LEVETLSLPAGNAWKRLPIITRGLGDEWLRSKRTALARVPSAIMPNTWNFLLNPDHPEAAETQIIEIARADYDPRLFSKD